MHLFTLSRPLFPYLYFPFDSDSEEITKVTLLVQRLANWTCPLHSSYWGHIEMDKPAGTSGFSFWLRVRCGLRAPSATWPWASDWNFFILNLYLHREDKMPCLPWVPCFTGLKEMCVKTWPLVCFCPTGPRIQKECCQTQFWSHLTFVIDSRFFSWITFQIHEPGILTFLRLWLLFQHLFPLSPAN